MVEALSILRRKAGAGRRPDITAMTPEKAMKLAFGRAGRSYSGLALRMTGFAMERSSVAALAAMAGEGCLVQTLSQGTAAAGACIVEPGVIAAVIEAETMGRVGRSELEPRAATRIDALVIAGFLDKALAAFDDLAAGLSVGPLATGWRPGDTVSSATLLPLMLEDVPMRLFRLSFDFNEGARAGRLTLAMPLDRRSAALAAAGGGDGLGPQLQETVLSVRADVRAVLGRMALPLLSMSGWEPGTVVPLSREMLARVRIEDIDGETVAHGRLGQMNGARAVRIVSVGPGG